MEPEIARRCHDCGASVRSGSLFCPQCGKALKTGAASANSATEVSEVQASRMTDPGRNASTIETPEGAPTPAVTIAPAQENFAAQQPPAVESHRSAEVIEQPASSSGRRGDDDRATSKRQRVTAAARDVVEEKLSPRVEKLRHASNVMLEEAAYDPSLRFVLVAIIIVILSLLLLLLNYLLG
ncbi:MAG TPA: zinc-ribbon domain-containing protein [Pyrinomonadaceae bacterium]